MTHNPAWHAEYLRLENAENAAREVYRVANRVLARKRVPAGAQAACDAALAAFRAAGKARFDFEMAGVRIVNISTLPTNEWAQALRGA